MKPRLASVMSRRRLLVGGLTAAAGVVVAACTGRTQTASTSSPSPSATGVATPACVVTPTETEGPYFFDDTVTDAISKQAPYSSRPNRDTRNQADMVYMSNNNSGAMLLAALTPTSAGYAAAFSVGLNLA